MSTLTSSTSKIINSDKPRYQRKPKKDGTARKARIFGRPWWYEKAGWSEDKVDERRAAIVDRLKEKWTDWQEFKDASNDTQEVLDWIKPLIATFDDGSWCLPGESDPSKRIQEQLAIYSEWAKAILRDSSRMTKTRRTPNQNTISRSPQSVATSIKLPEHPVSSWHTGFTPVNRASSYGTDGALLQRWRQTRTIDGLSEKGVAADDESETDALATTWNFSRQGSSGARNTDASKLQSDYHLKPAPFTPPTRVEGDAVSAMPDYSDDDTEITEVSDSEPARRSSSKIKIADNDSKDDNISHMPGRKWQDVDWDDVVVSVDATEWLGETFPIPMTMLKPGSSRTLCRWDDFELHDLYARFEVETGQKIDWAKHLIVSMVNNKPIAINTPGKYKLMLKEFSEKTRPGSQAMALFLRVVERSSFAEVTHHRPPQTNQSHDLGKRLEKRSQFTGAASDFSSDTESESTEPPSKRQKNDAVPQMTSTWPIGLTNGDRTGTNGDSVIEQTEEASGVTTYEPSEELKLRQSPDEFTQESNTVI